MEEKNKGSLIPSRALLSIVRVSETTLGRKKDCVQNLCKNTPITNKIF